MFCACVLAALLQTAQLELGGKTIIVEIADTFESRNRGLAKRKALPDNHGMLFVFEEATPLSFWMKDTLIPLSIGFFDEDKKLLNTADMNPPSNAKRLPSYKSKGSAQYALEMPQGWFRKNNIEPEMKFTLHDQAP